MLEVKFKLNITELQKKWLTMGTMTADNQETLEIQPEEKKCMIKSTYFY